MIACSLLCPLVRGASGRYVIGAGLDDPPRPVSGC